MALNGGADEAEARRERQGPGEPGHGEAPAAGLPNAGERLPPLRDDSAAGQGAAAALCDLPGPGGARGGARRAPSPPPPGPSTARGRPRLFGALPPGPPSPPGPPEPPGAPRAARGGARVGAARAALLQKLLWAAQELPRTASLEASAQLCGLVRACADALGGLQALDPPPRHGRAPPRNPETPPPPPHPGAAPKSPLDPNPPPP
ncbi:uncharacterized protein ACIQIH_000307 [Cyanocitta cristata]